MSNEEKKEDFVNNKITCTLVGETYHYLVTESVSYRTSSKEKMTAEEVIAKAKEKVEVTRFEVINHANNDKSIGRILTMYKSMGDFKEIEVQYQDGGRTIKVFLR
jgi:hypothetical protein